MSPKLLSFLRNRAVRWGAIFFAVQLARGEGARDPGPALVSRAPLAAQAFYLLPAGAIRPTGWLRRQLEIQAAGLSGHLDETWASVGPDNGWLGGAGDSWERGPYYLDGLVPLAWQLDSAPLKAKAQKFIDWTLDHARPDGRFGPAKDDDWWPRMVMLKVLAQYHELTGDPRVLRVMTGYVAYQLAELPRRPLAIWGRYRWADELYAVVWLYNRTGDARCLELARLLKQQGYDWRASFADFRCREKVDREWLRRVSSDPQQKDLQFSVHGVNNAQGLKEPALWSLVSGDAGDREAIHQELAMLDRYHGLPNGMFSADEQLAGREPSQGTETCTVVETMFSLELALAVTGDALLADRLEQIAYNALPAALTDDMWARQYDQQPNQVQCSWHREPWTTNGADANLFGLETQYGCCTANFHQGWPKFTNSLWQASADGGLVAALYAPCELVASVGGTSVKIEEQTEYPFRDRVTLILRPERPTRFPLRLRIPGWARGATIRIGGEVVPVPGSGTFVRVEREWRAGDTIELHLPAEPVRVAGFHGAVSFQRGPLVFALPIAESWVKQRDRGLTADWQVYPTSAWNFGVLEGTKITVAENPLGPVPFSKRSPAVTLTVTGRQVPGWHEQDGSAAPVPAATSPSGKAADCGPLPAAAAEGPACSLTLIPYAAAKLRITAFPVVRVVGSD